VSTSVTDRPLESLTVCAPLVYEPLAIPMLAEPWASETSLKTGFALGKLLPTRTVSVWPFTAIVATPPAASVRADVCCTEVVLAVWGGAEGGGAEVPEADEPDEAGEVACDADTCWTKGSLPAKVSKE
jgi:hypothetical protein